MNSVYLQVNLYQLKLPAIRKEIYRYKSKCMYWYQYWKLDRTYANRVYFYPIPNGSIAYSFPLNISGTKEYEIKMNDYAILNRIYNIVEKLKIT